MKDQILINRLIVMMIVWKTKNRGCRHSNADLSVTVPCDNNDGVTAEHRDSSVTVMDG
jgi:hypothetical protein